MNREVAKWQSRAGSQWYQYKYDYRQATGLDPARQGGGKIARPLLWRAAAAQGPAGTLRAGADPMSSNCV
eukprot:scaffold101044_cov22-Prasinocladus_malaysianus.AAC.1